ncbi:serine carboxypeptidase-like 17 [Gastrolobium bilobum]|uniref:serine carboxypeptidase-like 17 n=1 Tax=Gastrolobium bilobum TaxID=150636 RepID=UPI002AAF161A|nr:serine carboxypeptidase-like 17 [Gastrolobium bilobum]
MDFLTQKPNEVIIAMTSNGWNIYYKAGHLPLLNIQGFVLASPLTDDYLDFNTRVQYAHQRTLISNELYESIKASCNGDYINLNPNNTNCMSDYEAYSELVRYIDMYRITQPSCIKGSNKNRRSLFDDLETIHQSTFRCREDEYALVELWANDPNVRKDLNVREGTKGHFKRCNHSEAYIKNVHSVVEYHQNLTNTNLRSLIYIGDLDMATPYIGVHSIIKSLNLKLNSTWRAWFVDGEVAGYTEGYKNNDQYHLTYATVKGGGHVAQEHTPKEVYEMIQRWFSYYDI